MRIQPSVRTGIRRALVGVIALALAPVGFAGIPTVELQLVTNQLDRPVVITNAGDGTRRLFVGEQTGAIRIVTNDGTLLPTPFLDLDAQSACCGERGLLGIAFHPNYGSNGYFFVHYSDNGGDTVISRFTVSAGNPNVANPASELELLTQVQPYSNHNGGQIEFGPDGYLYIALGDGGDGGDPGDRAQNLGTLLGKLLRIDVDNPAPPLDYGIPASNPFVGVSGAEEEIWAYGLRNPWRFSFDRQTGDLFIGDVGQGIWEEIDFQPAASAGGENWGWRCYEGNATYNTTGCGPIGDYDFPIITYQHTGGNCSVNGGYRYRGATYPNLAGMYIYGDYCTGIIWGASEPGGWSPTQLIDAPFNLSSFGEDEQGELYAAQLSASPNGAIYRIVDTSLTTLIFADGFESGGHTNWWDVLP